MPRSRHDPTDALLPETPDGYSGPERFEYSMLIVTGLALLLLYLGMVGFGWVLFEAHEPGALEPLVTVDADETGFTMEIGSPQFLAAFVAAVVVLVVVHEGIHGLVYGLRGYDVSYGAAPQLGAVYAAAFHQFQTREDNLVAGIAPLLVIDAILLDLLFVPIPIVAVTAFLGLLFNTAGAAGDLYLVAKLLRLPEGTLLYDSDVRHMFVFYPEERSERLLSRPVVTELLAVAVDVVVLQHLAHGPAEFV